MADEIKYQYHVLQEGIDEMQRSTRSIMDEVETLRSQTQDAMDAWETSTSATYQNRSRQISRDFTVMNRMLQQLEQTIGGGSEGGRAAFRQR